MFVWCFEHFQLHGERPRNIEIQSKAKGVHKLIRPTGELERTNFFPKRWFGHFKKAYDIDNLQEQTMPTAPDEEKSDSKEEVHIT